MARHERMVYNEKQFTIILFIFLISCSPDPSTNSETKTFYEFLRVFLQIETSLASFTSLISDCFFIKITMIDKLIEMV